MESSYLKLGRNPVSCDELGHWPFHQEVTKRLIKSICDAVPVSRIYVFGSRANGKPRADSDLDLYVVTSSTLKDRIEAAASIQLHLLWLACDKDVATISEDELADYLSAHTSQSFLLNEVLERGILIYRQDSATNPVDL